jgi:hypothetical protein
MKTHFVCDRRVSSSISQIKFSVGSDTSISATDDTEAIRLTVCRQMFDAVLDVACFQLFRLPDCVCGEGREEEEPRSRPTRAERRLARLRAR